MSSNNEGDLVQGAKLFVRIAQNGHSYELDCNESTPVEVVQQLIASVAGINSNDQLLLSLEWKLEPPRQLSAYNLPSDNGEVFVYNKARLQANSPPPEPELVDILEIVEPLLPSSSHNPHLLDDASDPALKALPSYERQFRYHFHRGRAIYSCTVVKYENCQRLWREQGVQERALEIARANLEQFYRMVHQNFVDFMKFYSQQHRIHSDLLMNFGRDIDKLRSCKLHPALQTANRKCLLDFVKEENLRKWMENCSSSHRQFETKVSQFKQMYSDVKRKVDDLLSSKTSLHTTNLELMIKEHQRYINEQKSIMQSLSKDVSTVKKLVHDSVTCQLSSSLRPHDAVSALGPMYDVHDKNHLPKMQACDHSISKLLDFCIDKKNEMNNFVHNYMQRVTYVSYIIKDTRYQFPVFKEAMARQDTLFADLKLVRGIGPAYRACLAEVVRRKASMKLYMGMAGQLAEKLATKREAEVRRREEFVKAHNPYIPRDILASMGLNDTPNQCDVNLAPFDTSLLDIDISNLDRYAPEYLAGLPSKIERHGSTTSKGSFSMSHSAEAEENTVDALEKYDSEELLDGCELVEIVGTSKLEVENAKLKAELASAIASICSFGLEVEYDSLDDSKRDHLLKSAADKTAEALHLKDEYGKHLESMLRMKQIQCVSYEKRIQELEQKLSDQYLQSQKLSGHMPYISTTEPMDEMVEQLGMALTNSFTAESTPEPLNVLPCDRSVEPDMNSKISNDVVLELQSKLAEKTNQLDETEAKLKAAVEEVAMLSRELENSRKLLDESQMNCAHLENCLHEAREEAQTHLCAADRRASEYSALRASAVKMRGLFERLRSCVNASVGVVGFADSLRALAQSLTNSIHDNEDDGIVEFRQCIRTLADKVGILSRQRAELLDRSSKFEAGNKQLMKELEEKKELVKTLYTKHQLDKQANKERISFGRFEVHEIAAFVLNSAGHYEAINRNCSNYYLSTESVALFADHLSRRPSYIIGQIVHIERQTVRPLPPSIQAEHGRGDPIDYLTSDTGTSRLSLNSGLTSNPYGLPIGCEYFIVTVAMLPETTICSPPPS
ncbi:unnamed protein product, partial [Vitis vinifera]